MESKNKKVTSKKTVTSTKKSTSKVEKKPTPVTKEVTEKQVEKVIPKEKELTDKEKEENIKIIYKEKEKSLFSKILNIVLWVILLTWMAVCLVDFYKVSQEKDPVFCIKKETTNYDDGTVDSCLGLGYKVYKYNRKSYSAIEFGPFWGKDRSIKNETK